MTQELARTEAKKAEGVTPVSAKDIEAALKAEEKKKLRWSEKTTGEKSYEIIQFIMGKVFIVAVTAFIAFRAHPEWGADRLLGGRMPNYLKRWQKKADDWVLKKNSFFPFGEKGPFFERIGHIIASTFLISHGGNAFAPFIRWLENSKESISQFFNRHIGKPGEFEKAHERLKDEPKQSWGDTVKSRIYTFFAGFVAATGTDALINKFAGKHKSGYHYLTAYEEGFGRWLAGFTKKGKELNIHKTPITQPLSEAQEALKTYRFGRLVALDLYITTATLILWTAISRSMARSRHRKEKAKQLEAANATMPADVSIPEESEQRNFTSAIQPRDIKTDMAAKAKGEGSYADMVARQEMDKAGAGLTPA